MRTSYGPALEDGMIIVPASKSAAIRIRVPPSAFPAPLTGQEAVAEVAIRSAARLLRWYVAHRADAAQP